MLLPHMVVKGKVGSVPVLLLSQPSYKIDRNIVVIACGISDVWAGSMGCPQNGQRRFDTSCTTALQFSSQDHLA